MKENKAFKSYSLCTKKNNKKTDRLWMKFSSNPNVSVPRCLNPLFQRSLFRCPSLSRISQPQIRINKIVNSVDYHPSPSRLVSRTYSFIFWYTHYGFIPLHDTCWIFFQTCIFHHVGKILEFLVLTFLENTLNLGLLTHIPISL